jgi:hypothetical protein
MNVSRETLRGLSGKHELTFNGERAIADPVSYLDGSLGFSQPRAAASTYAGP